MGCCASSYPKDNLPQRNDHPPSKTKPPEQHVLHDLEEYFSTNPALDDPAKLLHLETQPTDEEEDEEEDIPEDPLDRLSHEEQFLEGTRDQTRDYLRSVYTSEHQMEQTKEGKLMTSLCEDIFSLSGLQIRTIQQRLSQNPDALVMAVCLIFSQLQTEHINSRNKFLRSFKSCCAAANDFQRMSERVEEVMHELIDTCDLHDEFLTMIEESCSSLESLYIGDAVFAAQKLHMHIFRTIWDALSDEFFSPEWETELTYNETAIKLTKTLDDYMKDMEVFLDDFLLTKCVDVLVTSFVIFYMKCLILKAEQHVSHREGYFGNNEVALDRMDKDIKHVREYFDSLALRMPALGMKVEREFEVLTAVQELMRIAVGLTDSDASDFILVLHKSIRNTTITRYFVGDLWHLMMPTEEKAVVYLMDDMDDTLSALSAPREEDFSQYRMIVPGLEIDKSFGKVYAQSKRRRPEKMVLSP